MLLKEVVEMCQLGDERSRWLGLVAMLVSVLYGVD